MSVTWLFLGFLHLGDAEAQALAAMLRENRSLTWMNLCNNRIGETGAQARKKEARWWRWLAFLVDSGWVDLRFGLGAPSKELFIGIISAV